MPTQNIAEFFLYIAPGYLAIRILQWILPVRDRDNFHDIASSIIIGVSLVSLLKWIDKKYLSLWLGSNAVGLPGIKFLLAILGSGLLMGVVLVCIKILVNWLSKKGKWLSWMSTGVDMVWVIINDRDVEDWAVVYLDDGSIYYGWISKYTYDPNCNDQDFLLSEAIRVTEDFKEMYEIQGMGVYLNTRNIKRIEFIAKQENED